MSQHKPIIVFPLTEGKSVEILFNGNPTQEDLQIVLALLVQLGKNLPVAAPPITIVAAPREDPPPSEIPRFKPKVKHGLAN